MTDPYADWDGAYVLGALTAAEREEYERHLAGCRDCTQAVAELLPLPGLLGRVDEGDRAALLAGTAPEQPPAGLEQRLLAAARREAGGPPWWRRARTRVALGVAAAAAVAVAVVLPLAQHEDEPRPTVSLRLQDTAGSPLTATVDLTRTDWGTRIDMVCFYAGHDGPARAYGLYVVDASGAEHEVASWHAAPGQEARTTGTTELEVDQLASLQVRAADGRTVLLSAHL